MSSTLYNFLIDCSDSELSAYKEIDIENLRSKILHSSKGDIAWCLRAYLILRRNTTLAVMCSNSLRNDAINIVHSDYLMKIKASPKQFIVCVQADFPHREWAHYHIVHNQNQLNHNCSFIPFWVQPELIKRDPIRNFVKRVAYSGQIWNGNLAGSIQTWKEKFLVHNLEFTTLEEGSWHDMSQVDILIGIRSFDKKEYNNKPATKLVNAWHAHIPFVGGNDSAFKQVGTSGEDYLLANTLESAIEAAVLLKNDEQLYAKIVENGVRRTKLYNNETISEKWKLALSGPVLHRYNQWKKSGVYESIRFHFFLTISKSSHKSKKLVKSVGKTLVKD